MELKADAALVSEAQKLAGAIPGCSSHKIAELLTVYLSAPHLYRAHGEERWRVLFGEVETRIRAWVVRGRLANLM